MILNALNQYQTSFRVQSKDGKDAFPALQNIVYGWIREKEKDNLVQHDKKAFFTRCDWKNLFDTRSSIGTNIFLSEEYRAWAFRYAERDRTLGQRRNWYTDIGLKKIGDEVIFYARVSYARGQHDLSATSDVPESSIPRFIRYILKGPYRLYSSAPAFGLFDCPVPVESPEHGESIAQLIKSSARRYPLIVCNGASADLAREARDLAYKLAGKCQVILLGDNEELARNIGSNLPRDLWVAHGKLRVFFRISGLNLNPHRHRYYDIDDPSYPEQKKGIINGLLRNHALEEDGCIQNISEIGRLLTLSKLHRFKDENPDREAEVNEVYALVDQIEKERDDFKQQADYFAGEHDAIETELRKERAKNLHFAAGNQLLAMNQSRIEFVESLTNLPGTLSEVVHCFRSFFPENVIFTEDALKAAESYSEFSEINSAWQMLYHLDQTLHSLKFESTDSIDLEKVFQEKSGYALAMSEGRQTKRNSELMALRRITHDEKDYDITPHLKWGKQAAENAPHSFRLRRREPEDHCRIYRTPYGKCNKPFPETLTHDTVQETNRSSPSPGGHQYRLGAGEIHSPRASEHSPPLVGATPAGSGSGGDLCPDGRRSDRLCGRVVGEFGSLEDPCEADRAEGCSPRTQRGTR